MRFARPPPHRAELRVQLRDSLHGDAVRPVSRFLHADVGEVAPAADPAPFDSEPWPATVVRLPDEVQVEATADRFHGRLSEDTLAVGVARQILAQVEGDDRIAADAVKLVSRVAATEAIVGGLAVITRGQDVATEEARVGGRAGLEVREASDLSDERRQRARVDLDAEGCSVAQRSHSAVAHAPNPAFGGHVAGAIDRQDLELELLRIHRLHRCLALASSLERVETGDKIGPVVATDPDGVVPTGELTAADVHVQAEVARARRALWTPLAQGDLERYGSAAKDHVRVSFVLLATTRRREA